MPEKCVDCPYVHRIEALEDGQEREEKFRKAYYEERESRIERDAKLDAKITEMDRKLDKLEKLKLTYPHMAVYPTPYRSSSNGPYSRGTYCSGWATICSDTAFGNLPWKKVERPKVAA